MNQRDAKRTYYSQKRALIAHKFRIDVDNAGYWVDHHGPFVGETIDDYYTRYGLKMRYDDTACLSLSDFNCVVRSRLQATHVIATNGDKCWSHS